MTLCTRSNSPSRDASRSSASGLKRTRKPCPVRSELGFFRLVRLLYGEEVCFGFQSDPTQAGWERSGGGRRRGPRAQGRAPPAEPPPAAPASKKRALQTSLRPALRGSSALGAGCPCRCPREAARGTSELNCPCPAKGLRARGSHLPLLLQHRSAPSALFSRVSSPS